jgi:hypothetical protein
MLEEISEPGASACLKPDGQNSLLNDNKKKISLSTLFYAFILRYNPIPPDKSKVAGSRLIFLRF